MFLHSYTDLVPDLQFVVVKFNEIAGFKGVGANFSLTKPFGLADEFWNLISSHFERLKLIDRYDELGNDEIAEILKDCHIHLESGGQNFRKFLRGRAKDRCNVYGRNHWIAVLMESMAKHANLDRWVKGV
ncbi:Phage-related protein [Pseudomonas syringae pv. spinaceae]|uniref:Phage-related protein n=2 Tax=Pseudomonas syringae TaxID=317 RepID=A0A0Q0CIX6_PSESX|nr:Phage-related protein [Pseudomonas syringae pv. spinaceae]RMT32161.1 Phage-related protein [Pseudomonas syringae pv. spinaceae]